MLSTGGQPDGGRGEPHGDVAVTLSCCLRLSEVRGRPYPEGVGAEWVVRGFDRLGDLDAVRGCAAEVLAALDAGVL